MITIRIFAALGLTAGLFFVLGIRPEDLAGGVFGFQRDPEASGTRFWRKRKERESRR